MAVLTDLHICDPWSPLSALDHLVDQILVEAPDLILLPGDFLARNVIPSRFVPIEPIAEVLSRLQAPLGVYASLGNHDWRDCPIARANDYRFNGVQPALEAAGIPVLSNRGVSLTGSTWLVGLDSQQGIGRAKDPDPRHDLGSAFADVPDGASVILMAHEPDIFLDHDCPAALQVSGHTHAGQINLFGWRPATPSRYGGRLAHGLHAEGDRRLIVSAGLGYSGPPVRFMAPPEWVMARVAAAGGV
ncbi:metallophosphoesterase [Gymnodinialimonas sp. 2305UL16-5]|uniref:metallophosphoesterase n=1 Tax=Gymnodinialimonas mytili TaxID=3126503 RepID=UPI003098B3F1